KSLHDGLVADTALPAKTFALKADASSQVPKPAPQATEGAFEIVFRADPTIYDGRFANNGWLQELPKSLSKLTWDNAAIVSPATADSLALGKNVNGYSTNRMSSIGREIVADQVELQSQGPQVNASALILAAPSRPRGLVH